MKKTEYGIIKYFKKIKDFLIKSVDRFGKGWYINQAVAERGAVMYLEN